MIVISGRSSKTARKDEEIPDNNGRQVRKGDDSATVNVAGGW
jgi:hypothetical protein